MPRKKTTGVPIAIDAAVYQQMIAYAEEYNLSIPDLVARMWALWQHIQQTRAIMPMFPPLKDELDVYLAEVQAQADELDEDYGGDDEASETSPRDAAIAAYQQAHPFEEDSDQTLVECPHCHRQTPRAGLVYLPGDEVKCTFCHVLPRLLGQFEESE